MSISVDVQVAEVGADAPADERFEEWLAAVLEGRRRGAELSVRIVCERESADLNERYRGRRGATNVLAFPADLPDEIGVPFLGDLVICRAVVEREAADQGALERALSAMEQSALTRRAARAAQAGDAQALERELASLAEAFSEGISFDEREISRLSVRLQEAAEELNAMRSIMKNEGADLKLAERLFDAKVRRLSQSVASGKASALGQARPSSCPAVSPLLV